MLQMIEGRYKSCRSYEYNETMKKKLNDKRNRKIAIISREADEKTPDIEMLEAELLRRGASVETLTRLLTKGDPVKLLGYMGHVVKQIIAINRSDVVVLDTYCIPVSMLPRRRGVKVVQMWHALSAVKKFGWQTVGMPDGTSPAVARIMKMHRGYDYVVSCSDVTARHFSEAFRTDLSRIIKAGLPRIDRIKSVVSGALHEGAITRITRRYPQLAEYCSRKGNATTQTSYDISGISPVAAAAPSSAAEKASPRIVLYAPTFHKGSMPDVKGLADALDPERFTLVVKLHPLYRTEAELPQADNIIYDEEFTSYEWLALADVIISDYSSLVVEASLADKPMYLYTYDIDTYSETTGLNMDFSKEAIAPYVFTDPAKLAAALDQPYDIEALLSFRNKYIDISTDNCTSQLADIILNI